MNYPSKILDYTRKKFLLATYPIGKGNDSIFIFTIRSFFIAIIPSLLLITFFWSLMIGGGVGIAFSEESDNKITLQKIFGTIFFGPMIETFVLAAAIKILKGLIKDEFYIAIICALAWGLLHGTIHVSMFFGTVWTFFVLSYCFMLWRKISLTYGIIAAYFPHALINFSSMLIENIAVVISKF